MLGKATAAIAAILIVFVGMLAVASTALADSPFDEFPTSECGARQVVFAMTPNSANHSVFLNLPAGIYGAVLAADGDVQLGPFAERQYEWQKIKPSEPYVEVTSWRNFFDDPNGDLMTRRTARVGGRTVTIWQGLLATPGGDARFGVHFFGYPDNLDEWHRSSSWYWMIYRLRICTPPERDDGSTLPPLAISTLH
ncbi:MAG: hypothetical protein OXD50_14090 [Chloroflexi bacterium]|nr:hypothetical protein [Chloroflexota bacterium]